MWFRASAVASALRSGRGGLLRQAQGSHRGGGAALLAHEALGAVNSAAVGGGSSPSSSQQLSTERDSGLGGAEFQHGGGGGAVGRRLLRLLGELRALEGERARRELAHARAERTLTALHGAARAMQVGGPRRCMPPRCMAPAPSFL